MNEPTILTNEQAEIWRAVVGSKPEGWFGPDTAPLLVQYCRATSRANDIAGELNAIDVDDLRYRSRRLALLDLEEKQSRSVMALARSMRLTQQSQIDPKVASHAHQKHQERIEAQQ